MKKYFYFFALMFAVVGFAACNDDEKDTLPFISFEKGSYTLGANVGDEVIVTINATKPVEKETEINFTASSADAANYTLSAEKFVIKMGETAATVKVTRAKATQDEETLVLTLVQTPGEKFQLGTVSYTNITLTAASN